MALAACARCKKLFDKFGPAVCPECLPDEEDDFAKIRDVLALHAGINAEQTAELADVEVECVLRMLEQGRIAEIRKADPVKCGRCGAPAIDTRKRLCESCRIQLDRECADAMRSIAENYVFKTESSWRSVRDVLAEKRISDEISTGGQQSRLSPMRPVKAPILPKFQRNRQPPKNTGRSGR